MAMSIDKDLIEFLLTSYGPWGILAIILFLLLSDPDRAEKWKAMLLFPLYKLFRCGSRAYMGSEIGYQTTTFIKNHLTRFIPSLPDVKVRIKWVTSPSDPTLNKDGALILRIRETDDQARNVLSAARVALPQVVCSTLRTHIDESASTAIDLTILRDLATKLGRHAHSVFQRHFLALELEDDERVATLFSQLVELDNFQIFVPIFLEELNTLGDVLFSAGKAHDVTNELLQFLELLLRLARRSLREEIPMEFHSEHMDVALLLLAIGARAEREGTVPYVNRINRHIALGCDSIYIVAYPVARGFLKKVVEVVDGDNRLTIAKTNHLRTKHLADGKDGIGSVVLLRRNTIHGDSTFSERLEAAGLREGKRVSGVIRDVSQDKAVVEVNGISATINKKECSWRSVNECEECLQEGRSLEFLVKSIDWDLERIALTRRFPEEDPWISEHLPEVGCTITVRVHRIVGSAYLCAYAEDMELMLPMYEVSWLASVPRDPASLIGTEQKVVVTKRDDESHSLQCSVRQTMDDPWPQIHERYPKGTELHGRVIEVTEHFVRVELPEGMEGIVPKEAMQRAGFEYSDFQSNVVPNQGMDVVVTKVFLKKRRIRLDLKRNVAKNSESDE